jgi:hypothetical protein
MERRQERFFALSCRKSCPKRAVNLTENPGPRKSVVKMLV